MDFGVPSSKMTLTKALGSDLSIRLAPHAGRQSSASLQHPIPGIGTPGMQESAGLHDILSQHPWPGHGMPPTHCKAGLQKRSLKDSVHVD